MNVTDITNSENKNPSEVLLSLIDKFSNVEMSRGELIQQIMNRARLEDIPTEQIRTLIVEQLKAKGLSDATIRRALPQELKHSEMVRVPKPKQIETETIDIPIPTPRPVPEPVIERKPIDYKPKIQTPEEYAYGHEDTAMINKDTDTEIDQSVYREPDRIEPKPEWIPTTKPELEQSYHTMNVPDKSQIPSSEWIVHNQPEDYTVTTQLQIYNGTGNNVGKFTVDVVAKCYPSKKTVVLEPIDKATIKKVVA